MNKELINKYKAEFEHYLNDGTCLYKLQTDKWYQNVQLIFTDYDYKNLVTAVVIDDEYVEFRQALCENKTVQYYVDGFTGWQDVTTVGCHCIIGAKNYRIKPEESQFKIGDYVRYIHSTSDKALQINNINGDRYYFKQTEISYLAHELELWQPKPNEWCWFWS